MRYRIKPKRDFGPGPGYWLPNAGTTGTGKYGFVKSGFVVTYDEGNFKGCNAMPAATWFLTVAEAIYAIGIFERVEGNAEKFWELMHNKNEVAV